MNRALLQRALDALQWASDLNQVAQDYVPLHDTVTALRAALATQPAPVPQAGPVAWRFKLDGDLQWQHTDKWQILPCFGKVEPLYTHPPAPVPVPLTDEQIADCATTIKPYPMELAVVPAEQVVAFARAIERAHGIAASPEVPRG